MKDKIRIAFTEGDDIIILTAIEQSESLFTPILFSGQDALQSSMKAVKSGKADAVIAGLNHTTRDVIIAARETIDQSNETFSSSFIMELPDGKQLAIADCATCKNPTADQLTDIVVQTAQTVEKLWLDKPKIALLSFSTHGSGGKDPSISKINDCLEILSQNEQSFLIDGELQLDAAVNPEIAHKKAPNSPLKGNANVLITPDLNSGNILYKSIQQFAGAKAYGPILQGFNAPICDLSRGATIEDIVGAINIMIKLASN